MEESVFPAREWNLIFSWSLYLVSDTFKLSKEVRVKMSGLGITLAASFYKSSIVYLLYLSPLKSILRYTFPALFPSMVTFTWTSSSSLVGISDILSSPLQTSSSSLSSSLSQISISMYSSSSTRKMKGSFISHLGVFPPNSSAGVYCDCLPTLTRQ